MRYSLIRLFCALSTLLCFFSSQVFASGFQLFEQDAGGVGDYHAGGAAIADNATTEFYNASGMVRIPNQQMALGVALINTDVEFEGSVASTDGTGQGGVFRVVPNFSYVAPISKELAFGFGVTAPFGLATDYAKESVVADYTTLTEVETMNFAPSLAYAFTPKFSFGAGFDTQKMKATFNNFAFEETDDKNNASSWSYGWHAGLLYQFTPKARAGLSFRSQIRHHLEGTGVIIGGALNDVSNNLRGDLTVPSTWLASYYQDLSDHWSLLGSVTYTRWDVVKHITLRNLPTDGGTAPSTVTINQNFRNTYNVALGLHYRVNAQWKIRSGIGYDQTPTNDKDRNLRMPGADRIALALGTHYQVNKQLGLDAGWTHLFIHRASIDNVPDEPDLVDSNGRVESSADVYGFQLVWNFA